MELKTFGAVLTFALKLEDESLILLKDALEEPGEAVQAPALIELFRLKSKHRKALEQVRRENVTEMILEPVAGLNRADFEVEVPARGADSEEFLKSLLVWERVAANFCALAAEKVKQGDVARTFKRLGREKEALLVRL